MMPKTEGDGETHEDNPGSSGDEHETLEDDTGNCG